MKKKQYQVYWSESAQFDLETIIAYIAAENITNARNKFIQIKESCTKLGNFPTIGRISMELNGINIDSYREIMVSVWRMLYRVNSDSVDMLAIIDSRRDLDYVLLTRMLNR